MANKSWQPGMKSPNAKGRSIASTNKRYSVSALKLKAIRFLNRELTPKQLEKLYGHLMPGEQLKLLQLLMEYSVAKPSPDQLTAEEIDQLHKMIQSTKK
jgi:hypothetical protein